MFPWLPECPTLSRLRWHACLISFIILLLPSSLPSERAEGRQAWGLLRTLVGWECVWPRGCHVRKTRGDPHFQLNSGFFFFFICLALQHHTTQYNASFKRTFLEWVGGVFFESIAILKACSNGNPLCYFHRCAFSKFLRKYEAWFVEYKMNSETCYIYVEKKPWTWSRCLRCLSGEMIENVRLVLYMNEERITEMIFGIAYDIFMFLTLQPV